MSLFSSFELGLIPDIENLTVIYGEFKMTTKSIEEYHREKQPKFKGGVGYKNHLTLNSLWLLFKISLKHEEWDSQI